MPHATTVPNWMKIDHSVLLKICNTAKVSIWSFMKKTCKFPHQQKGPPNQNLHHLKTSTPKPFWDCDSGRGHVTIASFIVSQPLLVWRIQGYLVPWNPFGSLEYKNRKTYPGFLQKQMFESHSLWALALLGLSIPSTKNRVRSISISPRWVHLAMASRRSAWLRRIPCPAVVSSRNRHPRLGWPMIWIGAKRWKTSTLAPRR